VCATEAPLEPLNGIRLQLRELCRHLAAAHEVFVLAYGWPDQRGEPPAGVELRLLEPPAPGAAGRAVDRVLSVVRREPVDVVRLGGPMSRAVAALLSERRFDVAHVTLGELAELSGELRGLPAVIVPLDAWNLNAAAAAATASGVRRHWLRLQRRIVSRFVSHAYRPFARVVLVSEHDARETLRLDPSLRTAVIPNGVDAARFQPVDDVTRDRSLLLFTGALRFPPNADTARLLASGILPRVRARLPRATLAIVGRDPGPDIRALADLPGVQVIADAPDLRPWLARAGVYACPMTSGTGIKNKLLEAMACGAPVVATPLACQGLGVQDGRELLIAEDDGAFAAALLSVLSDAALMEQLGSAARRYVLEHHDWRTVARAFEAVYTEAIVEAGPR